MRQAWPRFRLSLVPLHLHGQGLAALQQGVAAKGNHDDGALASWCGALASLRCLRARRHVHSESVSMQTCAKYEQLEELPSRHPHQRG